MTISNPKLPEVFPEIGHLQGLDEDRGQNGVVTGKWMQVFRCDQGVDFGGFSPPGVVLFDRDGVINIDHGYVSESAKFQWVDGVRELITELRARGLGVGIVTNQSGIGRGYYSEESFLELTEWVNGIVPIEFVVYCPHAPEAKCPGRKPGRRMLDMALTYFGCDPKAAMFVGDKETDGEAALAAGVLPVAYESGDLSELVFENIGKLKLGTV